MRLEEGFCFILIPNLIGNICIVPLFCPRVSYYCMLCQEHLTRVNASEKENIEVCGYFL